MVAHVCDGLDATVGRVSVSFGVDAGGRAGRVFGPWLSSRFRRCTAIAAWKVMRKPTQAARWIATAGSVRRAGRSGASASEARERRKAGSQEAFGTAYRKRRVMWRAQFFHEE